IGGKGRFLDPLEKALRDVGPEGPPEAEGPGFSDAFSRRAYNWTGRNFGTGTGVDFRALTDVYLGIAHFAQNACIDPEAPRTVGDMLNALAGLIPGITPDAAGVRLLLKRMAHQEYPNSLQKALKRLSEKDDPAGAGLTLGSPRRALTALAGEWSLTEQSYARLLAAPEDRPAGRRDRNRRHGFPACGHPSPGGAAVPPACPSSAPGPLIRLNPAAPSGPRRRISRPRAGGLRRPLARGAFPPHA
ncbi:MAG: hypothetical protein LBW85_12845, partial [Deltaproteobacteria bacterium]|nr:hypothetical protein [Deltaproteobacteria bacterium]